MTLQDISLAQALAALIAVGAVWTVMKKLYPGIKSLIRLIEGLKALVGDPEHERPGLSTQVARLVEQGDWLNKQLHNNGGESLRDRVDQIAACQGSQAAALNQQAAALEALAQRLEQK